ncbi:phosphopantetheine-binding protein [Pseudomonas aeruginosa]|uniref:phosphopantetheine-binding protein n=1 Tax=Pseudomonas aeruginosa TaxID=287 RepID=UPI00383A4FB0
MQNLEIKALMEFLRDSGEQDEAFQVSITEEHADLLFEDLGFDSLALLNVVEHLRQRHRLDITYDIAVTAKTPRELLRLLQGNSLANAAE